MYVIEMESKVEFTLFKFLLPTFQIAVYALATATLAVSIHRIRPVN